ncbi:hypothetical protein [Rubricoccus marinus]|uniref:YtkA-like domain-containing protein n=1 Tax=Rubricoccus marinus TaxID=716817 RepID=A0A259U130_9BACT|nr:hypothetical protein [Rubricoccus marinus]OZC03548.1 hypothetical protein BSZ36_11485 [Rubricoccus marinus]
MGLKSQKPEISASTVHPVRGSLLRGAGSARALATCLLILVAGCVPDGLEDFDFQGLQPPPPPDELTGDALVGTASGGGLDVELYAARGGAHLGYVRLGLRVARSGEAVRDARIVISATPEAGPASGVALPVENPATAADADGFFRGAAFLLTPDTTARDFTIRASVETLDGASGEVTFAVEARNDLWMQKDGDLLVSWIDPLRPVVGNNLFTVAALRWTGSAFVPADGLGADLYPYMDMGGGDGHSTPHSAPEALGDGRYSWDVDFIMSGGWEMTVTLTPPGESDATARFVGYTVYDQ